MAISYLGTAQENVNSEKIQPFQIGNHTYKTYDDGSQISYFEIKGQYSLKELHRIEQKLIDTDGVIAVSIFEKDPEKTLHTIYIKTTSQTATKLWLSNVLNNH